MNETTIITQKEKGLNRNWKNFLDKDYLGSHNLERGEEMLLTIVRFVGEEQIKTSSGDKNKPVLYFKENVPKMIMNITNGNTISSLYGSQPENWIGKQIQVFSTKVKAFGKTQDALRIRDFIPKIEVSVVMYKALLEKATTLDELKNIWIKFPTSARNDTAVIAEKDIIKNTLTVSPAGQPQQ